MRNMVLVAPHFTPSNLASVHRSRLWAQSLHEFGWNPIILATHWDYYEEPLDWDLHALVDENLEVIRTRALPIGPLRLVGDIGVRSLVWHRKALDRLAEEGRMDLLHVTIPPHYSGVLGRLIRQRHGTPYGLDYIDPWVHDWVGAGRVRDHASAKLATILEPWAVRDASLITGVAAAYYEPVLERHPHLRDQAVTAAMPYGGSELDFDALRSKDRATFVFPQDDGNFHMVYAGAMLPKAHAVLERFFEALVILRERRPQLAARLRIHFVGTGKSTTDPESYSIKPLIERHGVGDMAEERPARIPYVDVLNHLSKASGNLIVGSTERHYTPSKSFQSVQARRPLLALLHEDSSAAEFLTRGRAATVVPLTPTRLPDPSVLADTVARFIEDDSYKPEQVDWTVFDEFSARNSARILAEAATEALARSTSR